MDPDWVVICPCGFDIPTTIQEMNTLEAKPWWYVGVLWWCVGGLMVCCGGVFVCFGEYGVSVFSKCVNSCENW